MAAIDSVGTSVAAPGDMAVRFSFVFKAGNTSGVGSDADTVARSLSIPFTAYDGFTAPAPLETVDYAAGVAGSIYGLGYRERDCYNFVHGELDSGSVYAGEPWLWVGDRVYIRQPSGSKAAMVVTAVTTNTFNAAAFDGTTGTMSGGGTAYISRTRWGRRRTILRARRCSAGTRGRRRVSRLSRLRRARRRRRERPRGSASGSGGEGTPLQFGWFPVTLTAGTMQRLCLFAIDPGLTDSLVIAPTTVTVGLITGRGAGGFRRAWRGSQSAGRFPMRRPRWG